MVSLIRHLLTFLKNDTLKMQQSSITLKVHVTIVNCKPIMLAITLAAHKSHKTWSLSIQLEIHHKNGATNQ